MFSGSYIHLVDQKSRIAIPSKIRNQLGDDFILTKGPDNCLWALTNEEWRTVAGKASKSVVIQRFFVASAVECTVAKGGRIVIPDVLREHAGIKPGDEVMIVGLGNHIEIWNKAKWQEANSQITSESIREELPEFFRL